MGRIKDREFWQSANMNNATFMQYFNRLTELSISMFEWKNLPETVDPRFLELTLFGDGMAIFFEDEVLGFCALRTMIGGKLNIYQIPTIRTAYASNGYNMTLDETNSVIVFNNMLHTNSVMDVEQFSKRLYNLDRMYDGNAPVIFGDKNLNPNSLKVLTTGAPYVADKIYQLKVQIWNEALTYLGISNINITKKERLITDEVTRNQGGTIASRYSRLEARRQACKQINDMFGLDIWVDYREDYQVLDTANNDTVDGDPNSDGIGGEIEEGGDKNE